MYHIYIIQTIILSYISGNTFKMFIEFLKDARPTLNLYDVLVLNHIFILIGIILFRFLPNLNFKIFIEKNSDEIFNNIFNVLVNILASIVAIAVLYLLFLAIMLNQFIPNFNYNGFSCYNGFINGGILFYILENKLFKLPDINKTQKLLGYTIYIVTYLILIYQ